MADSESVFVVKVADGEATGPLAGTRGDIEFPAEVRGWSDVLDCRLHPYCDKDIAALRHHGVHVGKLYLLVPEEVIEAAALVVAPDVPILVAEEPEE
jgi:hypothetical protein